MLLMVSKMKDLHFSSLMAVYEEGNRENGAEFFPQESPERQQALAEQEFYNYLSQVFFPTPGALYALWEENGKYVCALRLEPYRDGLLLEALETAPEARRKGYAKKLVTAVQAHFGSGKIYSHVGKRNVASLKTHEACGFRRILEYAVYIDGSVNDRCCTLVYELKNACTFGCGHFERVKKPSGAYGT